MANIKVSQMPTATSFDDDDYVMIIQSNTNKKITKANMYGNYAYSTSEKVIGKWIDDKPLYRQVVSIGPLPDAEANTINHNIANIDKVFIKSSYAIRSDGETLPIPYVTFNSNNNGGIIIYADRTNITIGTTSDRSAYNGYIVLEYTKTTD